MATKCEFEEKEYEGPLYNQLLAGNQHLWPVGQVFEGAFGGDAVLFADNTYFWSLFRWRPRPIGVVLDNLRWGSPYNPVRNGKKLPTFRTNLYIQAKRPDHRKGKSTNYASHGITGAYWQFDIKHHQQQLLEHLHSKLASRALVCYASPCFHTSHELYDNITNRTVVENSTFVRVHRLTGHSKWVYDQAGTIGLACSDPKFINDESFESQLENLSGTESGLGEPIENLTALTEDFLHIVREIGTDNPITKEYLRILAQIEESPRIRSTNEVTNTALNAVLKVDLLCDLLNLTWFVVG